MKFILIVGASGVGKDTLLKEAQKHFANSYFIKRYIDRMPSKDEDNYFLDSFEFERSKEEFVSIWKAHNQIYGVKKADLKEINIISISRQAILDFEAKYQDVSVIHIKANKHTLEERLQNRARESLEEITKRLLRSDLEVKARNLIEFYNDLPLEDSSKAFNVILKQLIKENSNVRD